MLSSLFEWYDLTDHEREIRDLAREVAQREIAPRAAAHDLDGTFVRDSMEILAESGLMGANVPKEYGGMGGTPLSTLMAIEEISAACGSTGVVYHFHLGVANMIRGARPDVLRQKYLPGLAKGEIGAFGFNERAVHFWQGSIDSTIEDRGDHFILNGEKPFVTAAGESELYLVHVQHEGSSHPGHWSYLDQGFVLVEGSWPGVSAPRIYDPMGIRGSASGTMRFENVIVPKENLLGGEPWGVLRSLSAKASSPVGPGIVAAGVAGAALNVCARHVRTEGKITTEWVRHMLEEMSCRVSAMRFYNYFAGRAVNREYDAAGAVVMEIKTLTGTEAPWVCDRALEIMGGSSFMRNSPVQRFYRDARACAYLNVTMDIRRSGGGMIVAELDEQAENPQPKGMPWEPDATIAYRMFAGRAVREAPQQAKEGAFSIRRLEENARSRGEDTVSFEGVMEYQLAFMEASQASRRPEMAHAGGPPRGFPGGGPPPGFGPPGGPPRGFPGGGPPGGGPPEGFPGGGPPPGFRGGPPGGPPRRPDED